MKKIQEVAKINVSEPPSFWASMYLSLHASECLLPSASAGFAKRKYFILVNSFILLSQLGSLKDFWHAIMKGWKPQAPELFETYQDLRLGC